MQYRIHTLDRSVQALGLSRSPWTTFASSADRRVARSGLRTRSLGLMPISESVRFSVHGLLPPLLLLEKLKHFPRIVILGIQLQRFLVIDYPSFAAAAFHKSFRIAVVGAARFRVNISFQSKNLHCIGKSSLVQQLVTDDIKLHFFDIDIKVSFPAFSNLCYRLRKRIRFRVFFIISEARFLPRRKITLT